MPKNPSPKFSFRAVEVFVTIVEEGTVSGAAKRLGASPSAVSLQLSNLEAALGARLLERSSRHLSLTAAGDLFLPRALNLLDDVSSATAALSRSSPTSRLLIKMSVIEDYDALVLPNWLMTIKRDFPNLRFHVQSGPSHENHAALANRSADMIVAIETSEKADWVEDHGLMMDPYLVVCSARMGSVRSIEELLQFPFVRYSREQFMARQIEAHLKRSKWVPAREHEFSSNQAVLSMVDALGGWTITTACAFASVTPDHEPLKRALVAVKLPLPAFSRKISLYARKDALGDMPLRFAQALRSNLRDRFPSDRFEFLDKAHFFPDEPNHEIAEKQKL